MDSPRAPKRRKLDTVPRPREAAATVAHSSPAPTSSSLGRLKARKAAAALTTTTTATTTAVQETSRTQRPISRRSPSTPPGTRGLFKQFAKSKVNVANDVERAKNGNRKGDPSGGVVTTMATTTTTTTTITTPVAPPRAPPAPSVGQGQTDDGKGDIGEEAVVRTSGRARRMTAKLLEDGEETTPGPRGSKKKSKMTKEANEAKDGKSIEPGEASAQREMVKKRQKDHISLTHDGAGNDTWLHRKATTRQAEESGSGVNGLDLRESHINGSLCDRLSPDLVTSEHIDAEEDANKPPGDDTHKTGKQMQEPFHIQATPTKAKKATLLGHGSIEPAQAKVLQTIILEKATGRRPIPIVNLEDEYVKVSTVISQTITAGESNSMLLIGARGTGKTAMVNHILSRQSDEHHDDFHVVRLSGFIHTDDKIALREIWRQLGREMELDEDETSTRSYADTMSTLLALLSHPAELGQDDRPDQIAKSVIFVLDEFELFASHPRQTLLYNLFDIAQSRKAPIAVLGLTTRIDVAESLEKRVKSRFSHRYVHLSLAKSFDAFTKICKAALTVQLDELKPEETDVLVVQTVAIRTPKQSGPPRLALESWDASMELLFSADDFLAHLRRIYYTNKSVPDVLASVLVPLATLQSDSAMTTADIATHLATTLSACTRGPDSKLSLLASLSTLQLALLVCAARQSAIHSTEVVTFSLAYEEYKALASKTKLQATASGAMGAGSRVCGKDVARRAWGDIIEAGLVMEDRRGGGGRVDIALEEIEGSGVELGQWGRWCREI